MGSCRNMGVEPSPTQEHQDQQGCATQPIRWRSEWTDPAPIKVARAALAEDLPTGRHMIAAFRMMAKHAAQSEDHDQRPLAEVFDLAATCIENELTYFTRLKAAVEPVLAAFPPTDPA